MLPFKFAELQSRLKEIRSWAGDLTDDNRCATVVGLALRVKPTEDQISLREVSGTKAYVRGQPFLEGMYVKAQELADSIGAKYGPPDYKSPGGKEALKALQGQSGVIYLEDCWARRADNLTLFTVKPTGDHVDLWDGKVLEIYRHNPEAVKYILSAKNVLLWKCSG